MLEVSCGFLDSGEPLPFEHLFIHPILDARKHLRRLVDPGVYQLLSPEAHAGWERYLLTRLTAIGCRAAHQQFSIFQTVREAFPRQQNKKPRATDSLYHEFVGEHTVGRLQDLFERFPMLRVLCHKVRDNWVSAVSEFLLRLEADREQLRTRFDGLNASHQVTTIEAGLSDPHRGGRCVVRVIFASGGSLFYKPRSIAPELQFASLLDQFNREGIPFSLKAARCWDRESYGWMEDFVSTSCADVAEVRAFYWRAGALLGLLYLAQGVDFHRGNLVALGEFPVLIDLETLWHPQEQIKCETEHNRPPVLRTGFLPPPVAQEEAAAYRWSALECVGASSSSHAGWTAINRDAMAWSSVPLQNGKPVHLPRVGRMTHLASDYVPEVQAGFRWLGERLLGDNVHRRTFQDWLAALANSPRRRITHSSAWYHQLLERSTQPQFLTSNVSYADAWDELVRIPCPETQEELYALEQHDIPYFCQPKAVVSPSDTPLPTKEQFMIQTGIIAESLRSVVDVRSDHSDAHHGGIVVQRTS